MNSKLNEELLKRLDALAAKLGIAGSYLWQLAVRQTYIEGIKDLFSVIGCLAFCLWAIYAVKRLHHHITEDGDGWEEPTRYNIGLIVVIIAAVLCFFIFASSLDDAINAFGNPQFYALKMLVQQVK